MRFTLTQGKHFRGILMNKAIIFSGLHSLDFSDIRHNVIRIPEVINKIKQAGEVLTSLGQDGCFTAELFTTLASDNATYSKNIKLKSVLNCIVQLGLFDRYTSKFGKPNFLLGDINGDSPLNIVLGKSSFESLFKKDISEQESVVQITSEPLLSGVKMNLHQLFKLGEENFVESGEAKNELGLIVKELIEDHQVKQIIDIGPGSGWAKAKTFDHSLYDVQILESIDMDPMLSWFWPYVKNQNAELDLAN